MKVLLTYLFLLFSCSLFADNDKVPYDSLVEKYYADAKSYMKMHNYDSAHSKFRALFKLQSTIPDEAAYYYGLNQSYRRNYKQAVQGFEKYIKLRGYNAVMSDSSLFYISKSQCLEKGYIEEKENCTMCNGSGHVKMKCHYCKGVGKEYCPICNGAGVIVSKTNIGDNYQQCYKCNGTGIILCTHCNGTTFEDGDCPQCRGNGFVLVRKECK